MLRFITTSLAATALCACVETRAADAIFANGFEPARWVMGYYVGYERNLYPPDAIDFDAVTHLMVGRARPLAGGALSHDYDIDDSNGPIWAHAAVDAAHAAGRKAILMVGGAGEIDGWRDAASSTHRAAFVTNLLAAVDQFGYDGLDLDWEPLESFDQADFIALAQALRGARAGLILTVPLGWINANFAGTPDPFLAQIAPLFERIDIMSYDMEWPADGWQSWHSSALHGETGTTPSSISSSVAYYLASGVPAAKLGIGSGFYGVCWHGVTAPHQTPGSIVASDGAFGYAKIMAGYYSAAARQWDATAHVPYLSSQAGLGAQHCNFLSYEDPQSLADKGAYAKANGLGGIIIWTISQGYLASQPLGQRDPLLEALRASYLQ